MGFKIQDANLSVSIALPTGASTVYSAGIDLGHGAAGDFVAEGEVKISAPALGATPLPDSRTMTYSIQHDTDAAFGTPVDLYPGVLVQTGAAGAGAAAATFTARLPVDVNRYIRLKAVGSYAGDKSGSSATLEILS